MWVFFLFLTRTRYCWDHGACFDDKWPMSRTSKSNVWSSALKTGALKIAPHIQIGYGQYINSTSFACACTNEIGSSWALQKPSTRKSTWKTQNKTKDMNAITEMGITLVLQKWPWLVCEKLLFEKCKFWHFASGVRLGAYGQWRKRASITPGYAPTRAAP